MNRDTCGPEHQRTLRAAPSLARSLALSPPLRPTPQCRSVQVASHWLLVRLRQPAGSGRPPKPGAPDPPQESAIPGLRVPRAAPLPTGFCSSPVMEWVWPGASARGLRGGRPAEQREPKCVWVYPKSQALPFSGLHSSIVKEGSSRSQGVGKGNNPRPSAASTRCQPLGSGRWCGWRTLEAAAPAKGRSRPRPRQARARARERGPGPSPLAHALQIRSPREFEESA